MAQNTNPFEALNAINSKDKDYRFDEETYNPFIINRSLSYHLDSILLANEMNKLHDLPKQAQYNFYYHGISPRTRFAKWIKPEQDALIDYVSFRERINTRDAKIMLSLLSEQEQEKLLKEMNSRSN